MNATAGKVMVLISFIAAALISSPGWTSDTPSITHAQEETAKLEGLGELGAKVGGQVLVTDAGIGWLSLIRSTRRFHVALDLNRLDARPDLAVIAELPGDRMGRLLASTGSVILATEAFSKTTILRSFNVSDPRAPVLLGEIELVGHLAGALVHGDRLYTTLSGSVAAFDLSDPSMLRLIGRSEPARLGPPLASDGRFVYASWHEPQRAERHSPYEHSRMQVVDFEEPTRPRLRGNVAVAESGPDIHFPARILGLAVHEGHVFLHSDARNGLFVYDVADVDKPQEVYKQEMPQSAYLQQMIHRGHRMHFTERSRIRSFDIGTPSAPVDLGTADLPIAMGGLVATMDFGARTLLLDYRTGLRVVDLNDELTVEDLSSFRPLRQLNAIVVDGDGAFAVDDDGGLRCFDVRDPENMKELGRLEQDFRGDDLALKGSFVFAASWGHRVAIVDVSDPSSPIPVASLEGIESPSDFAIDGDTLYVTGRDALFAVDISDPATPAILGRVETPRINGILARDGLAFASAHSEGLFVVDFSRSEGERIVAHMKGDAVSAPQFFGDLLAASTYHDDQSTILLVDIEDPLRPRYQSRFGLGENPGGRATHASDGHLFIGFSTGRLVGPHIEVLDLRRPERPAIVASASYTYAADMSKVDDLLFVADRERGLLSFRFTAGSAPPDTITPTPDLPLTPTPTLDDRPGQFGQRLWLPWLGLGQD